VVWSLRSSPVSSHQPLPLIGQACELEMSFSLGDTMDFNLLLVSPRQCSAWLSPQGCCVPPPPQGLFQLHVLPPHPQAEGKYSLLVFVHQCCSEGVQSALQLCQKTRFPPKQCVALTLQVGRFTWLKTDRL
jgi:hypothetical protein